MVSIALSSPRREKIICWICILVSCFYCWRRHTTKFVEVRHERDEDKFFQQVELHERKVWRKNICDFLQPCRPTFSGYKVIRCRRWGCSGCSVIMFPFWTDCEEAQFCSMRYYLATHFRWNNSWNYLQYSVEMTRQINNDTMGLTLINNTASPHIWLAQ